MGNCRVRSLCVFVLFFCILLTPLAFGQRDMGAIVGVVIDPTGGVIPGASVTITDQNTGISYSVITEDNGTYARPLLKPGTYSVEVEMAGFRKFVRRDIRLEAGSRVAVDAQLEVGEVTQVIEVTGTPPALQTETTEIGGNLEAKAVSELPLGGQRKFTYLARVQPAILPAEPGARDALGGGFSAYGVRSNGQNNFLLNGVDNNVNVIDFINQTAYVIGPAPDAIGEMKIITHAYSAEYGRGAGGVINLTLKSGTNAFHGSLFEFHQNDNLNANRWENNRNNAPRGHFLQNQFGGSIGGPIVQDRTFFFFNYQGTRIRSTRSLTSTIPYPEFRNGDFSGLLTDRVLGTDVLGRTVLEGQIFDIETTREVNGQVIRDPFPGNIIPENRWDPVAARLIALYPNPNQNLDARIPGSNYFVVKPATVDVDQWDVRIDEKLSDSDSLFGSVSWSTEDKFQEPPLPGALDAGGFAGESELNQGRNAMLSWTRVWSPSVIHESRLAFTRLITARTQANAEDNLQQEFGIGGLQTFSTLNGGLPNIQPAGYTTVGGSEWLPTKEYSNVWSFIQNVSLVKRSHSLKFGFEYRDIDFPFFQVPSPRGTMRFQANRNQHPQFPAGTGDGIAAWLLGYPGNSRITSQNFISSDKKSYAWYVQDDWKITPRVTLNIGMRYELYSPIGEKFGRQSTFDQDRRVLVIPEGPDQDTPLPPNFATDFPQITVERGLVDKYMINWDTTNWGPRIGLAWQFADRSVLRMGYGIFYGGEENQGGNPNRGENPPFNSDVQLNAPDAFSIVPALGRFSDGFPVDVFTLPAAITFRSVNPNFRTPLVQKWNVTVQRELGYDTSLEVAYLGSRGHRLVRLFNSNQPRNHPDPAAPTAPRRLIPFIDAGIDRTDNTSFSRYHGLAAKLEKTFSNGTSFLGSYTWSHALTNSGTTLTGFGIGGPRDITNQKLDYAHAQFHIPHRFSFSGLFELPFGQGRRYGSAMGSTANAILGGWQVNTIVTLQRGNPFSLGTNRDSCGCGGTVRPDLVPGRNPNDPPAGDRSPDLWFDITAVTDPAPGTYGNLGHFSNYGPAFKNVDLSLFKNFPLRAAEDMKLQFRAEFFNLFNTSQFNVQDIQTTQGSSVFGRITGTLPLSERRLQFALRLEF